MPKKVEKAQSGDKHRIHDGTLFVLNGLRRTYFITLKSCTAPPRAESAPSDCDIRLTHDPIYPRRPTP